MNEKMAETHLRFEDTQWPKTGAHHTRQIVRAVVVDEAENYYFLQVEREDEFGCGTFIETAGGGVEPGEDLLTALLRELKEELGATVEVLGRIGVVEDDYNLICRHNVSHYFLCKATAFGEQKLTKEEAERFRLSILKTTYDQAISAYKKAAETPLGRLIAQRELPILHGAKRLLDNP